MTPDEMRGAWSTVLEELSRAHRYAENCIRHVNASYVRTSVRPLTRVANDALDSAAVVRQLIDRRDWPAAALHYNRMNDAILTLQRGIADLAFV